MMSAPPPDVSVVCATHDRAARLAQLLEALAAQTLATERFEVVVVDDGSADETPQVLEAAAGGPLRLASLRIDPARGPATARNAGWRAARAPIVAFTDDDCRPQPRWLEELLHAAGSGEDRIVQGRTLPAPEERHRMGPFARTVTVTAPSPYFQTCNIAYPRSLLERLGGFDEVFPAPAGEDGDLGWRAIEQGATRVFADEAVVHHAVDVVGAAGMLRRAIRARDEVPAFGRRPELRALLVGGVFLKGSHAHLLQTAAALAMARRHPPAALFAVPYALHLAGRVRMAGARPRHVPFLVVYDAVETAATIRGALRYRVPVV